MSRRNQRFRQYVGIPFRPKHCCDCEESKTEDPEDSTPYTPDTPDTAVTPTTTTTIEHNLKPDASLNSLVIERTISDDQIPNDNTQHTNVRDYFALTIRSKIGSKATNNKIFHGIRFDTAPIREEKYDNLSAIVPVQHGDDNMLDIFVQEREVINFDQPSIRIGEYGDIHNTYMNNNTVFNYNMYKKTPIDEYQIHGRLTDDVHGEAHQGMGNRILNMREIIDHLLPIGTIKKNITKEDHLKTIISDSISLKGIPNTPWLLCNGFDMSGIIASDLKELYRDFTTFLEENKNLSTSMIPPLMIPLPTISQTGSTDFSFSSFIHSGVIFNEQLLRMRFGLSGEIVFGFDNTHLMVAKDIIFDEELDVFFVVGTTSKNNQNGSVAIAKIPRNIRWNSSTNQADNIVTRFIPVDNDNLGTLGAFGTNIVNKRDGHKGSFYIGGIFVTRDTTNSAGKIKKEEYFVYEIKKEEFLSSSMNTRQLDVDNILPKNNYDEPFAYYYPSWDTDQFKFILSSLEMYYNNTSYLLHVVCNVRGEAPDASSNIFYIILDGEKVPRSFPRDISLNLPSVNLVHNSEHQIVTDIVIDNVEDPNKTLYVTGFEMRYHGNDGGNNADEGNSVEDISYTAYIAIIKLERKSDGDIKIDNSGNIDDGDVSFNILPDASFANAIATSIVVDNSNIPIVAGVQESGKGDFFLGMYNIHADNTDGNSDASFSLVGISAETYDIITDIAIDPQTNDLIVVGNKGESNNKNTNIIIQRFHIDKDALQFNFDNEFNTTGIVKETIRYTSQGEENDNGEEEIKHMFATSCLVDNRKNIIVTGHVNSFDSFIIALRETGERVLPGMHFSIGHDDNV